MKVLHVGCGGQTLPDFVCADPQETRLDADASCAPDVVASVTDMGDIGEFDIVYACHMLEHLAEHDVALALAEFRRVLVPGGRVLIIVPDLEGVPPDATVMYESAAGPVRGLDMYFGMAKYLHNKPYMAHRTGFVEATMRAALEAAGFAHISIIRGEHYQLVGIAAKGAQ